MSPIPIVVLALCGLAFGAVRPLPRSGGRIVGGDPTTIEEYPYQLSVRSGNFHFCGASIIGPHHALTAAHCVPNTKPSSIGLHSGTSYQSQSGERHQAVKITVHPNYRGNDYDYAIIEVETPFPDHAVELCSVEPSAGQTAVISGWGTLSSGGSTPDQLQVVHIPVISRNDCKKAYGQTITDRMICAAQENGGKDSCQGDSGGPLVVDGKQCGVVSFGIGCAHPNYPGVYASVANQLSWIQDNTRM